MAFNAVILCGGSGTRLWPLSRTQYPKQFVDFGDNLTLFKRTILRALSINDCQSLTVVCNEVHRFYVQSSIDELKKGCGLSPANHTKVDLLNRCCIILESEAKNTAPALAVASFACLDKQTKQTNENLDLPIVVFPADHRIEDESHFCQLALDAIQVAQEGYIVTFGINATIPETGYGYIQQGQPLKTHSGFYKVSQFIEKPNAQTASTFLQSKDYSWNSGMFVFKASVFLEELKQYEPEIFFQTQKSWANTKKDLSFNLLGEEFLLSPSNSIDYAVMERTDKAVVYPISIDWSDLGTWEALYQAQDKDKHNNVVIGDVLPAESHSCYLHSTGRLIAAVGLENIAVIETKDAVLVMPREQSQQVKTIVEKLKLDDRKEQKNHVKTYRPWGSYEQLTLSPSFQVKKIIVYPGKKTSLQKHYHRSEHWIIVEGTAQLDIGQTRRLFQPNESAYIPLGETHRISNPGSINLEIIEVQTGSYLGEDDIVRIEDDYGRKDK